MLAVRSAPVPAPPATGRPPGRSPAGRRGHSLVELVLVLSIGMILVAVVTPRVNRSGYDADAAARVVRGTLQTAQRVAVAQQADVIVGFDLANHRMRVLEDLNGNGRLDTGAALRERVTWRPLDASARFAVPPARVGGGAAPVTPFASITKTADALPSVTFHRDGAASENGEAYLKAVRGGNTEWRAVVVARATGRVEWWARGGTTGGAWVRRGL